MLKQKISAALIFVLTLAVYVNNSASNTKTNSFTDLKLSSTSEKYYFNFDNNPNDDISGLDSLLLYKNNTDLYNDLYKLIRSSEFSGKLSNGKVINGTDNGHPDYYGTKENSLAQYFKLTERKINDTTDKNKFHLFYSYNYYADMSDFSDNKVNREHIWCQSLSNGLFATDSGAGNDLHHIRLVNSHINSARNNRPYKDLNSSEIINTYYTNEKSAYVKYNGYLSKSEIINLGGHLIGYASYDYFEPADNYKGDIARILAYLITAYKYDLYDLLPNVLVGGFETLVRWNRLDPVDSYEINRNNTVMQIQGNRNPYIDAPSLIDILWADKNNYPKLLYDDNSFYSEKAKNPEYISLKAISPKQIKAGDSLIIAVNYNKKAYAISNRIDNGAFTPININENKLLITDTADKLIWDAEINSNGSYTFKSGNTYLGNIKNTVTAGNNADELIISSKIAGKYNNKSGYTLSIKNSERTLAFSASAKGFKWYKFCNSKNYNGLFTFYKVNKSSVLFDYGNITEKKSVFGKKVILPEEKNIIAWISSDGNTFTPGASVSIKSYSHFKAVYKKSDALSDIFKNNFKKFNYKN